VEQDPGGSRLADHRGLLHPDDREAALAELAAGVSERRTVSVECRLWHAGKAEYRLVFARGVPVLAEDGSAREWVCAIEDLSDRRRAGEERDQARYRLSLLEEAGRRFSSSLDYESTLELVARLAVPRFADLCLVDTVDPRRRIRRFAISRLGEEREELAQELVRRYQGVEIPSGGLAGTVLRRVGPRTRGRGLPARRDRARRRQPRRAASLGSEVGSDLAPCPARPRIRSPELRHRPHLGPPLRDRGPEPGRGPRPPRRPGHREGPPLRPAAPRRQTL
jgi:hypothetical protein